MVEYALLTAGAGLRSLATAAAGWISTVDWSLVWYVALALVALRIAFWAFAPRRPH